MFLNDKFLIDLTTKSRHIEPCNVAVLNLTRSSMIGEINVGRIPTPLFRGPVKYPVLKGLLKWRTGVLVFGPDSVFVQGVIDDLLRCSAKSIPYNPRLLRVPLATRSSSLMRRLEVIGGCDRSP